MQASGGFGVLVFNKCWFKRQFCTSVPPRINLVILVILLVILVNVNSYGILQSSYSSRPRSLLPTEPTLVRGNSMINARMRIIIVILSSFA